MTDTNAPARAHCYLMVNESTHKKGEFACFPIIHQGYKLSDDADQITCNTKIHRKIWRERKTNAQYTELRSPLSANDDDNALR